MSRKLTLFSVVALCVALFAFAAGCKSVRRVEAENRQLPLDLRHDDPYYNTLTGASDARPVHPGLTRDELLKPLSIQRCIALALEGHPEIRRWMAKIGEATGKRRELETMGWAELLFDITWAPDTQLGLPDPAISSGDRLRNNTIRLGVGLRQPIYFEWQRRRALLNANTENIKSLYSQMEVERNTVIADVCTAFLDIMQARLQCEHRRAVYELDRKRVAVVEQLVEKRLLLDSSLTRAKSFMSAAERDYCIALQVLSSRERKLKGLLGIDSRIDVAFIPVDFENIPLIPADEAADYLVKKSALFNSLDYDVRKAYWEKEFLRWGDIDSDIIIRYAYDFAGGSPVDDFMLVSWTLRYPLLHVKARNARVVQGLKRMEQFEIEREVKQQAAMDALERHYSTICDKSAEMSSFQSAIDEAQEDLRIAQVFELKGTPDQALKSDPENVLLSTISAIKLANARFSFSTAKIDYQKEILGLYATVGRAAELIEFAKGTKIENEIEAFSRSVLVPDSNSILQSKEKTEDFFNFCQIERISRVVVDFSDLDKNSEKLDLFLKEAHARSIKVVLKTGGAKWLDAPDAAAAKADLDAFYAFNNRPAPLKQTLEPVPAEGEAAPTAPEAAPAPEPAALEESPAPKDDCERAGYCKAEKEKPLWIEPPQKFDGLFIDLTGRALAEWDNDQVWPAARKARLAEILKLADESRAMHKDGIILTTAAPADADKMKFPDGGENLLDYILKHADDVAVIFDLDDEAAIVAAAQPILERTKDAGRIKIGVNALPDLPKGKSYAHRNSALFFGELAEIAEKLQPNPNFAGILIEDYPSLAALLAR